MEWGRLGLWELPVAEYRGLWVGSLTTRRKRKCRQLIRKPSKPRNQSRRKGSDAMRKWIALLIVLGSCSPLFAQQTFEQVWQSQWRSQVSGNFLSRRFEPQLKAACKEVWDTAQANVAVTPIPSAGCKCDSDPRGCLCKPNSLTQKHNYPCGDVKCPWNDLNNVSKVKAKAAPSISVKRKRRPLFPLFRRRSR